LYRYVEGGDGGHDGDDNRRGRAGSKLGYYDDAYAVGFNDTEGSSHGRGGGGGGGGGSANWRMLATPGAGAGVAWAEEQDTRTFLRYIAQATMLW
jgi:hypothetical protein